MKKRMYVLLTLILPALILSGCAPVVKESDVPEDFGIYASFLPVYMLLDLIIDEDIPGMNLHLLIQPQDGCMRSYALSDWDQYVLMNADAVILIGNGFESFDAYREAVMTRNDMQKAEKAVRDHGEKLRSASDRCAELESRLEGKKPVDISLVNAAHAEVTAKWNGLDRAVRELYIRRENNAGAVRTMEKLALQEEKLSDKWAVVNETYRAVSGQDFGKMKLSFETYVQQFYFKQVISAANKRLTAMTDGAFTLRIKPEARDHRSQSGLDLEVLDRSTGAWRDVSTLSGGESFMASMALALGLSDVAQAQSGGVRLDSMFIDEGFGSLDENTLRQAISLLTSLADGKRLVGVISHVSELKDRIDKKLIVRKKLTGSEIEIQA